MKYERKTSIVHYARLTSNEILSPSINILTVQAPELAANAKPGQFVQIKTSQYLRRPIGIMSADQQRGVIELGIRRVGPGSNELCDLTTGTTLNIVGPLGHGFELTVAANNPDLVAGAQQSVPDHLITVAGGTGLFPLIYLLEEAGRQGIKTTSVAGFPSKGEAVLLARMKRIADKTFFASETGGLDFVGHAGAALTEIIGNLPAEKDKILICACGPLAMLENVATQCLERKIDCQVSLEARMACGIGVCVGCSIPVYLDQDQVDTTYERCCYEGPVFPATKVVWPARGGVWG